MVYSAIAFLLGCVVISQLASLPSWPFWLAVVLVLVFAIHKKLSWLLSFGIALCWASFTAWFSLQQTLPTTLVGKDISITGTVVDLPQQQSNQLRFLFSPDIAPSQLPNLIRLNWYYPPEQFPQTGETWHLTVRLKPPFGMLNPGSFDYEGWLFQQGIGATGYVRDAKDNQRLTEAKWFDIDVWRAKILSMLHAHMADSPQRALVEGLTIGHRENMSPEQWRVLRNTGTSHLLAISGLHIGLAAALGFFLGRWFWSSVPRLCLKLPAQQFGAITAIIFALIYALLAGMSVPSQRALIMVIVAMSAILIRRRVLSYQMLSVALLAVLIWDPLSVLSPGLWLSFTAVSIIIYVSQNRYPTSKWHWATIHIWIAIGLTPFLFIFFNSTAVLSPIANVFAVPFVSLLVVPLLLLSLAVMTILPNWSQPLWQLADYLLSGLWWPLEYLAGLPNALWQTPELSWPTLLMSLIGFAWLLAPKGWPARWLGLVLLLPSLSFFPDKPELGTVRLTVLDVGQGLSVVVETKSKTLVFDTGPAFGEFNTGDAVVLPYLQYRGIQTIDKLIISHGDNDHIGGADSLLDNIPVTQQFTSAPDRLPMANNCYAGYEWSWDQVNFIFLHPEKNASGSTNERSCVLKISSEFGSVLLTGDIERQAEQDLVKNKPMN